MIEKLKGRICPECGEVFTKHNTRLVALDHILVDMICEKGHQWKEYYYLGYSGFTYQGKNYCSYGKLIEGDNQNEQKQV